jgi:hypothetical protein
MLTKNIYILYPAGYMGTYLNWIISISDRDLEKVTVPNPLTDSNNAHQHIKKPTHQSWDKTLTWIAYNRPEEKLIYSINCREDNNYRVHAAFAAQNILRMDSDPVIINLHDHGQLDLIKFGAISMFTKWPSYMSANAVWHDDYDPGSDSDIIKARNWLYSNWQTSNPGNPKINVDEILYNLNAHKKWFDIKTKVAAMEVNTEQYHIPLDISDKNIYDIGIDEIVSDNFIDTFGKILEESQCGNFDFSYADKFHCQYQSKQSTLAWFDAIGLARNEHKFSQWFNTNAITQSMFLLECPDELIMKYLDLDTESIAGMLDYKIV